MKAWDYDAVVYDGAVYCVDCLPDGVVAESADVHPIFASDEWDCPPVCNKCGAEHDYMSIIMPRCSDCGRYVERVVSCECGTQICPDCAHVVDDGGEKITLCDECLEAWNEDAK